MTNTKLLVSFFLAACVVVLAGCVSKADHEKVISERDEAQRQLALRDAQVKDLTARLTEVGKTLAKAQKDLTDANAAGAEQAKALEEYVNLAKAEQTKVAGEMAKAAAERDAAVQKAQAAQKDVEQLKADLAKEVQNTADLKKQIAEYQKAAAEPKAPAPQPVEPPAPQPVE
jgi:chromosome segregation ATPase